jgi:hypothetical protein
MKIANYFIDILAAAQWNPKVFIVSAAFIFNIKKNQ